MFLRVLMRLLFFLTFLIRLSVCMPKHMFLYRMIPSDLQLFVSPQPLYSLWQLAYIFIVFILLFMSMIFDFFLFNFISFLLAHYSQMSIIVSKFSIVWPTMLVSSANIYGYMFGCSRIKSVRSFVNMLNNIHEMLHPCPNPLPILTDPYGDSISRLLNISYTPCMTSLLMFILAIFWKRIQ